MKQDKGNDIKQYDFEVVDMSPLEQGLQRLRELGDQGFYIAGTFARGSGDPAGWDTWGFVVMQRERPALHDGYGRPGE